jgi:hypothetical protein
MQERKYQGASGALRAPLLLKILIFLVNKIEKTVFLGVF